MGLEIAGVENIIIIQNKIDLISDAEALDNSPVTVLCDAAAVRFEVECEEQDVHRRSLFENARASS